MTNSKHVESIMPPQVMMVVGILTHEDVGIEVRALCGRFIESYYRMNLRALKSKRHPLNEELDTEEELDHDWFLAAKAKCDAEEARLAVREALIEEAHQMVQAIDCGRDPLAVADRSARNAVIADKIARASDLLDSFQPSDRSA